MSYRVVVSTLWETVQPAVEPVLIAVVTAGAFALLRLVTPRGRWSRRLKHDADILGALPEGKERDLWAASVTAQAERLRLYREQTSLGQQFLGWYSFVTIVGFAVSCIIEASRGWPLFQSMSGLEWLTSIPLLLLLVANLGLGVVLAIRLVLGGSLAPDRDGSGHYPKYNALLAAEQKRHERRHEIGKRVNRAAYFADQERDVRRKAERVARRAEGKTTPAVRSSSDVRGDEPDKRDRDGQNS